MRCEVCHYNKGKIDLIWFGGRRPRPSYQKPAMALCVACQQALAILTDKGTIKFKQDSKDTTNSRYSIVKLQIKRQRWDDPNMPQWKIDEWIRRHPKRAAGINPRALRTNPRALKD
jgi:hypothetical protein